MLTFFLSGAFASFHLSIKLNSLIPEAANVLIGPALIAFILILSFPKSCAKYLTLASNAAFDWPAPEKKETSPTTEYYYYYDATPSEPSPAPTQEYTYEPTEEYTYDVEPQQQTSDYLGSSTEEIVEELCKRKLEYTMKISRGN